MLQVVLYISFQQKECFMDRRHFIKNLGLAAGAAFTLPRFSIAKTRNANSRVNVAFIGTANIGEMSINGVNADGKSNMVAFCDVRRNALDSTLKKMKKNGVKIPGSASKFTDYRKMLDRVGKDIDAVCVSTPDHSHFKIALDCMQAGKHVAVQKPLTHNVWQCRELDRARKYYKLQTQMLNQGHATDAIRMLREWYDSGVAGPIREVHVMCSGPGWGNIYFKKPKEGFPLKKEKAPSYWDMWLNQSPMADYNSIYEPLSWRGFWAYGTGMLGDWFCHTGDAPVWSMDLYDPESVELIDADCSFDQKVFIPNGSTVKWTFPATDKRPACVMYWYDGNRQPITRPKDFDEGRDLPRSGMLMIGDNHTIETGPRPNISPRMSNSDFWKQFRRQMPEKTIPRVRNNDIYCEWLDAIRGDGPEASSNFGVSSRLTETALLGCLAQRFGGKIMWDSKTMSSPNRPKLAAYIKEPERAGWESKAF